jgi:hypothetical protein
MMPDAAVEPVAKPSAHDRSELFPAMNRLLTPVGNVRATTTNPGTGTGHRASPLNHLFSSPCPQELRAMCRDGVGEVRKNRTGQKCDVPCPPSQGGPDMFENARSECRVFLTPCLLLLVGGRPRVAWRTG